MDYRRPETRVYGIIFGGIVSAVGGYYGNGIAAAVVGANLGMTSGQFLAVHFANIFGVEEGDIFPGLISGTICGFVAAKLGILAAKGAIIKKGL